jgi:hypothetical protein
MVKTKVKQTNHPVDAGKGTVMKRKQRTSKQKQVHSTTVNYNIHVTGNTNTLNNGNDGGHFNEEVNNISNNNNPLNVGNNANNASKMVAL